MTNAGVLSRRSARVMMSTATGPLMGIDPMNAMPNPSMNAIITLCRLRSEQTPFHPSKPASASDERVGEANCR
jgi:hypothetical protein